MNKNVNEQLNRMKAMMNYGLTTESKKQYSSVEYSKVGADGKMYGIVREGTKYYIKISNDKKNVIKENFDYIGGFQNRRNNEYSSYANALKQFDLKMMSLKEAHANGKNIIIESWNPDRQENLAVESTNKMRNEIMRQRQIMGNAALIHEGKDGCCDCKGGDPFCEKPKFDDVEGDSNTEKNNVKKEFKVNGDSKQKTVEESAEPLGWHKSGGDAQETIADTYMDKSHGTEIGHSGDPFKKPLHSNGQEASNGVVAEGESMAMDCGDNQNKPAVGVGEIGDKAPFDGEKGKQLDESLDTDELGDEEGLDGDAESDDELNSYGPQEDGSPAPFDGDEEDPELDSSFDDNDIEGDDTLDDELGDDSFEGDDTLDDEPMDDEIGGDVESRLSSIEDTLNTILDKLSNMETEDFEDDDLYDDDETEYELESDGDDSFEGDEPMDDEPVGDEPMDDDMETEDDMSAPMDSYSDDMDDEEEQIYESKAYRRLRMMNEAKRRRAINEENRLNDFGKHPAYRKHPMQLPRTGEDQNSHGCDWNDNSVYSEQPYGEKIGSGAPFEIDPQSIENSIAECVRKILGKRKNLR